MEEMENCLSPAAQEMAEARLAAKRAARAEAREIRMKELERQQKEVEERPDKDFNEKGSRTASSLSAATLASLGGTSSRRGSGDTSISVDTEASIREIKDSLAEVEEKYKKAMVSNAQLDNEKTNFMYQVETFKDVLLELEEQLAETQRQYEDKSKEFEREKHAHQVLQTQYNAMKESLQQREEMLTRHGIVLSSDLSPNGGILDGPYHETLADPFTKGNGEVIPVSKTTGDGPLGRASQTKIKSESVKKVEKGQSLQSSETVETTEQARVQDTAKALMVERTLYTDCNVEAGHARECSDGPASLFEDGLDENMPTTGDQISKRDMSVNEDNNDGSSKRNDPSTVSKMVECTSSDATEGLHVVDVKSIDTPQGQRGLETESGIVRMQEAENHEGERESCSDDFQDAVEFVVEQKMSCPSATSKETSEIYETPTFAADEESHEGPPIESREEGFHVKGILHNLGKHLDGFFEVVSVNVEGSLSVGGEKTEASSQNDQDEGVVETQEANRNRPTPSESNVCELVETDRIKEDDSGSVECYLNATDNEEGIDTCVGRDTPVEGEQQFKANITKTEMYTDQGNKELKCHVEVVYVEEGGSKPHSDDGEFFEFSNETGAALEAHLGEDQVNSSEHLLSAYHHEGTNTNSEHSSHSKEEGLSSIPYQEIEEEPGRSAHVGDGIVLAGDDVVLPLDESRQDIPNLKSTKVVENRQQATEGSSQLNERDLEICSAQRKADDEKDDGKHGVEGDVMTVNEESQTPPEVGDKCAKEMTTGCLRLDNLETAVHEKSFEPELKEDDQTSETQVEDGGSFDFDDEKLEEGSDLYTVPVIAEEFTGGKEVHMSDSTEINVTKTTDRTDFQKLQDQDILAPVKDGHHEDEGSHKEADQETEVESHSTSAAEPSGSEAQEATEQSTKSTEVGNVSVDPSDTQGLDNNQAYIKEDTLDRGIKRGKGKNKEDCLLS